MTCLNSTTIARVLATHRVESAPVEPPATAADSGGFAGPPGSTAGVRALAASEALGLPAPAAPDGNRSLGTVLIEPTLADALAQVVLVRNRETTMGELSDAQLQWQVTFWRECIRRSDAELQYKHRMLRSATLVLASRALPLALHADGVR